MLPQLYDNCLTHVLTFLGPWDVRNVAFTCKAGHGLARRKLRDTQEGMDMLKWNAQQGLDVLITCGSISATPVGIATFVIEAQQHALPTKTVCSILTPQRFAGVLSSEAAWKAAKPTAVAYLKSYDFTGLSLCQALRTLLWRTSVPQSTRSVSFLLRMFSARYFETAVNNDETLKLYFPDHDSVYLLTYGCFILNNDVHSTALKAAYKMTRERFIANHTATQGLEAVAPEYLGLLYDDIKGKQLPLNGWDRTPQDNVLQKLGSACGSAVQRIRIGWHRFVAAFSEE